jgi:predicted DNA-binding transcriptional regulator YafY
MARNDTVTRILKVIHYLEVQPQGLGVREIHSKLSNDGFEISERTIYRDLEAIESIHLPLTKTGQGLESRWKLESVASINQKIHFSYHELIALFLAKESLTQFKNSPLFGPINNLFSSIEKALGPGAHKDLSNLQNYMGYRSRATWQSGISQEVLDTIYDACAEGQVLKVTYRSKSGQFVDQTVERRLGPEGMYFADSGAYLIARDLEKNEHRTYALNRVIEAVLTEESYESSGFSMKEYVKDSIGAFQSGEVKLIEVEIQDPIAAYVSERRWHESQILTRTPNGIVLKMQVRLNEELARWILSLGPAVQKVEPSELRDLVARLADQVAANLRGKKVA